MREKTNQNYQEKEDHGNPPDRYITLSRHRMILQVCKAFRHGILGCNRDDVLDDSGERVEAVGDEVILFLGGNCDELSRSHDHAVKGIDLVQRDAALPEEAGDGDLSIRDPDAPQDVVQRKKIEEDHESESHDEDLEFKATHDNIHEYGDREEDSQHHRGLEAFFYLVNTIHVFYGT